MPTAKNSLSHILLMAYVLIVLYPFVFVLSSSFKKDNQAIAQDPWGLTFDFTFNNYIEAWVNAKIDMYFFNSFFVSTVSSLLTVLIAASTAFALTRMRFVWMSSVVYKFILLGLVIPGGALLIPIYFLLNDLGILNTYLALILPYITFSLPVTVFIIGAFMRSIPRELEEAAVVDGVGAYGLFIKIILPITMPALVTVFILNFLSGWNEFIMANFYISSESLRTLPVGMVGFRNAYNINYAQLSAGIVYSVLPVVILYSILQEKIIDGITVGSVKG